MKMIFWLCATHAASLATVDATAGVLIREKVNSNGFKGSGAFESSATRFTGAILKHVSGKEEKRSVILTRVDLDKRWLLDSVHKTYAESSVSTPRDTPRS